MLVSNFTAAFRGSVNDSKVLHAPRLTNAGCSTP